MVELIYKLLYDIRYFYKVAKWNILALKEMRIALFNDCLKAPNDNVVLQQLVSGAH
jgi:hypothetical protein